MATARVRLAHALPDALASELARRLYFVASEIEGFELVRGDGVVEAVDVVVSGSPAIPALEDKINRVVERELRGQRPVPPRTLWRSAASPDRAADAYPALLRAGMAFEAGEGQVGFGEPLISLMDWLDRRLRAIAMDLDGAVEHRYPTLLPTSALERIGYFASFPQFVMFVTRLHNDLDIYDAFLRDYAAAGRVPPGVFGYCRDHAACLPPTMCYHTYHQLRGRRLDAGAVVTSRGRSFRHESGYHAGLERLWDFTIREIVFLGELEFVTACRQTVMRRTFELVEELGLAGTCEVAHDYFFAGADTAARVFSQRLLELKCELRLHVEPARTIAAGSFNLHGPLFGEAFEIAGAGGQPAVTGCVGFGLERLVLAFLSQHGLDVARWPAAARAEVG